MKKLALLQILFVLSIALSQDGLLKIELSKNVDIVVERSSKDDPFNSIKITKDKKEILKLEDNKIFIANTFEVVYEGYDGAIAPNNSMSLLDFNNLDKARYFHKNKFDEPNYFEFDIETMTSLGFFTFSSFRTSGETIIR